MTDTAEPVRVRVPHVFFSIRQTPNGKQEWRWRMFGPGQKLIAVSGLGYGDKESCVQAIRDLAPLSAQPDIRIH
jgi:uncharacterized protein YegP (UPF0339 family)